MRRMKTKILSLLCASLFSFHSSSAEGFDLKKLTLDEKLGQLLLVGFRGTERVAGGEIDRALKQAHVGSVIYFDYDAETRTRGRNITSPAQLKRLSQSLQKDRKIPLLISVDEEGGLVSRLHSRHGFSKKLSPEALASLDAKTRRREITKLAREVQTAGINVNFAPLADVNINPQNPVIGALGRSFSPSAETVTVRAREFISIQKSHEVISVLKHFPGHGSSDADSHLGVVDVTDSWIPAELTPYKSLVGEGVVDMVMTAHIYQRHLDPDYPATLSQKILGGVLRQEIGYQGVVISDDMNMKAITDQFGMKEAMGLALNAGVDILLFGNNLSYDPELAMKAHRALKELVEEGTLSLARVDESVARILKLKRAL